MAVTSLPSTHTGDRNAPVRLRIEHMPENLGLDLVRPRLSWWLPPGASKQLAYRLRTKQWDSGRIQSDNNLLVELGGPALRARQRMECAVKVWTELGESDWSDPIQWEMGLLDPDDWKARWIEPPEDGDLRPGKRLPGISGMSLLLASRRARRDSMQPRTVSTKSI
jgi:alpha-L-rhamnosidase